MAVMNLTMRSVVLHRDVKLTIICPEDRHNTEPADPNKKYKALYILHGASEDNSTWVNSSNIYLNTRDLDLFVICVSAYNTSYVNTKYGWNMEDYITQELPVKMQNLFPISNKREDRYIMGESMGGAGTWHTTLKHPDLYAKAVPLSAGALSLNRIRMFKNLRGEAADPRDNDPAYLRELAKQMNDSDVKVDYYMMCGTEDFGYQGNLETEQFLREECPNISLKAEYWHGKHDFFFWNEAIPKALEFFGFTQNPDKIAQI